MHESAGLPHPRMSPLPPGHSSNIVIGRGVLVRWAMEPGSFSRTAEIMALFRAMEAARPADKRLFDDRFAVGFLGASLRQVARLSAVAGLGPALVRAIDRLWPGARTSGTARTRLIDDWIGDSVSAGTKQIVILGAGFDSRAWRLSALGALPVFEVDHPATSAEKRRRMASMNADISRVRFVAIDFNRQRLPTTLAAAGFDGTKRTAVVWEGVSNYLASEAVDSVLRWVAGLAPGSRLIFTYVHEEVLNNPAAFEGAERILRSVARAGEPWTFGLHPDALPRYLGERGLRLIEDLGAEDYRKRYLAARREDLRGYAFYRAAVAEVPERA